MSGPGSKSKKFNINVTKASKAYSFIAVYCKSLNDCKASNVWDLANKENAGNTTSKTTISKGLNKTGKIYYTDRNSLPGTKFYLRVTTYNSDSQWLVADVYEVKVNDGKRSCGTGYCYPVTTTWKWSTVNSKYVTQASTSDHYKAPATKAPTVTKKTATVKKTLKLNCPATAKVNNWFECTTDQIGVKITVGGAEALASGYNASFVTISSDLTKDIKYTNTLFNGTWTIRKDSNGKEFVYATIKATKSGYAEAVKYVKIYK